MKNFTEAEARALVGRRIRTHVAWSGVPKGTTGKVTGADPVGGGWDVAITWDLPTDPPMIASGEIAGEPVTYIRSGKPLTDWFTRSEYTQYLEELDGDNDPTP